MPKLILIKHASPYVIPGTPPERWRLSDKGIESCGPLAEKLRPHAPAVIVTSPEPKAAETGRRVGERLGVPVEQAEGLEEHDRSNVPHMRSGEFISHVELFFRRPRELVLGRETAEQAADRFNAAVDAVLKRHPDGNVAIVTHGTVLALFVAEHTGQKPFELWRKLGLPSFVVLEVPGYKVVETVERL
jgi:broad specificity phosphatase PhoE